MKIRIVCPGCNDYLEKDVEESEIHNNMVVCGKCKVPAVVYNADTGEMVAGGSSCMPGAIICTENSNVQAIVPIGLAKEDIIQSLRAIADEIESDSETEALMIAPVNITIQDDRMILIRAGQECSGKDTDKKDTSE
ncbi:MAG: hypothetical protein ACE14P_14960 [Methanotrichaceae archaeon]